MFVLYSFGKAVEYYYNVTFGSNSVWFFMTLYAGGLIVSDLPTFFKHKDDISYRGLGASGAVSSVVFASILFAPMNDILIWGILPVPGILLGIIYLVYSARMSKKSSDNINHDAHFYGAVFGFLFTLILKPSLFGDFWAQLPF